MGGSSSGIMTAIIFRIYQINIRSECQNNEHSEIQRIMSVVSTVFGIYIWGIIKSKHRLGKYPYGTYNSVDGFRIRKKKCKKKGSNNEECLDVGKQRKMGGFIPFPWPFGWLLGKHRTNNGLGATKKREKMNANFAVNVSMERKSRCHSWSPFPTKSSLQKRINVILL